MPSFTYRRSPSPTYAIPIPTYEGLPSKTVGFVPGPTPVTAISRALTNDELWTLYYFEAHARLCAACRDPYNVHRAGGRLCHQGHTFAQGVARFLWSTSNGRETFDTTSQGGNLVRLEIPQDYSEIRSLLQAMERSLRHRRQTPIVSFGVQDSRAKTKAATNVKTPERRYSVKESSSPSRVHAAQSSPTKTRTIRTPETSPQRYERREPEIVDWPEVEYEIREPSQIIQPKHPKRTSTPETIKHVYVGGSSPPKSSPSKRNSYQGAPLSRKPLVQAPQAPSRHRSRTIPTSEKDDRRRSMYGDYGAYNVEVREPKPRQKRHSMFLF